MATSFKMLPFFKIKMTPVSFICHYNTLSACSKNEQPFNINARRHDR